MRDAACGGYGRRMRYDDVVAVMFQPSPPDAVVAPTVDASPPRRLRDAIEPIAMHSVWSRRTNERLAAHGLDFMTSYVWGRAALLGVPTRGVVAATFAVFEPSMIGDAYEAGRAACPRDVLLATRDEATIESLHDTLRTADLEAVGTIGNAMLRALNSAPGAGRPLFGGLRDLAVPSDPIGRLWRGCELAREYRGDGHVAACTAMGLDPVEMNVLTEAWLGLPIATYSASRAWPAERLSDAAGRLRDRGWLDGEVISEQGRAVRDDIEARTDASVAGLAEALAGVGGGFDWVVGQLDGWSQQCIDADSFPPDAFKRAAG